MIIEVTGNIDYMLRLTSFNIIFWYNITLFTDTTDTVKYVKGEMTYESNRYC